MLKSKYNDEGLRWCSGYGPTNIPGHWVDPDFFGKHGSSDDGKHNQCNACMKSSNDRKNNPSKLSLREKNDLPINYVYVHKDSAGNILYVGIGRDGRAWDYSLRRDAEHSEWLVSQLLLGRGYQDITILVGTRLTRRDAAELENEMIKDLQPIFNRLGKDST